MSEQTPEPDGSGDSEPKPEDDEPQGLDLGTQDTEYIKKSRDPEDIETRDGE